MKKGFTLIELLITLGIVSALSATVVLLLNPAELFREARDVQRETDLAVLESALRVVQFAPGGLASANIVYASIAGATCPGSFVALTTGWSYACVSESALTAVNGTGWVPVNFSGEVAVASPSIFFPVAHAAAPLSVLPVDPTNDADQGLYYLYISKSRKFQLVAKFESEKFKDKAKEDGGIDADRFELGTDLTLWNTATGGAAGLSSGLVGYWKFDEAGGSSANDASDNGHTGELSGTPVPSRTTGKWGGGLTFLEGSEPALQYVRVPAAEDLANLGPLTISMWVKPSGDLYGTQHGLLSKGYSGSSGFGTMTFSLYRGWSGDGLMFKHDTTTMTPLVEDISHEFSPGQWYHVAVVWNGQVGSGPAATFYVDGIPLTDAVPELGSGAPASDEAFDLFLGSGYEDDWEYIPFEGVMDEVRLYNRALSQSEVTALYKYNQGSQPGLVGYWPFSEGAGASVSADASGNGNNAALTNVNWIAGKVGGGVEITGTGSYLHVPDAPELRISPDLTIVAWVRNDDCSQYRYLLEKGQSDVDNYAIFFKYCQMRFEYTDSDGTLRHVQPATTALTQGAWHQIALVKTSASITYYKDGALWFSDSDPFVLEDGDTFDLFFGKQNFGGSDSPWLGGIDELRIYNRALSGVEIEELYNADN